MPSDEESDKSLFETKNSSGPEHEEEEPDVHKLVKQFLSTHPSPSHGLPVHPLSCPVIVPQRRPHSRSRGFVRAYAPVLENCGIDQASFLEFLKVFHKASQVGLIH